jgi:hypothetical protein
MLKSVPVLEQSWMKVLYTIETMESPKKCSACGKNPRSGKHAYCSGCNTVYHQKRRETEAVQAEAQGFGKGVEAMRQTLANEFRRLGMARVTCFEVSEAIARSPRPQLKGS